MKKTVKVILNSIDSVKNFSNITFKHDLDLSLHSGRYIVDAKSIMGIFSLDLSKPIDLEIDGSNEKAIDLFLEQIETFTV